MEQQFRDKMSNHKFPLQPNDWEKMQKRLEEGKASKPRPIARLFNFKFILSAMTIITLLIAVLWHLAQPPRVQVPEKEPIAQVLNQLQTTFTKTSSLSKRNAAATPEIKAKERNQNPILTDSLKYKIKKINELPATPTKTLNLSKRNDRRKDSLSQKLQTTSTQLAQEKAYLHLDRTLFKPNEDLWFAMYLRDANTLMPSQQSQILYVDLIAPNGNVQESKTYLVFDGQAAGDFHLGASLKGGIYKLRAYTNWMKNTNDVFEREITLQAVVLPNLSMKLEFERKAYGASDEVIAKFDANTLENKALANTDLNFTASLAGNNLTTGTAKTDEKGRAYVKFNLPKDLTTNDGILNITIPYNGQTEAISRAIPIVLNKIDFQLLPEGGEILAASLNRIAFKALNEFGKPADVEGIVKNPKGETVTTFKSFHQGMGTFELVANEIGKYQVHITKPENITQVFDFEVDNSKKAIMMVDNLKDQLRVKISMNDPRFDDCYIVTQINDKIVYETAISLENQMLHQLDIPTKEWGMGIARITLFDKFGTPCNERLVFVNRDKALNINIKTDKSQYQPREKVSMKIKVSDDKGQPVKGNFSLAVADDAQLTFADDKQGHILSALLLESELKGKIEEPNFYFDTKEEKSLQALDYLMLTQGWRRLEWKEVLKSEEIVERYEFKNELANIKGIVIDEKSKNRIGNLTIALDPDGVSIKTNTNGEFEFKNIKFNSSKILKILSSNIAIDNYDNNIELSLNNNWVYAEKYRDIYHGTLFGKVVEAKTGEDAIGAYVKLLKNNKQILITGTDFEGNYYINIEPGVYDIEVSYVGMNTHTIPNMVINAGRKTKVDVKLGESSNVLQEVVVTQYKVPLVQQDNTTAGGTVTSEQIKNMPTRNVTAIVGLTPEENRTRAARIAAKEEAEKKRQIDEINKKKTGFGDLFKKASGSNRGNALGSGNVGKAGNAGDPNGNLNEKNLADIKGTRKEGTIYMVDGVRVQGGALPPAQEMNQDDELLRDIDAGNVSIPLENVNVQALGRVRKNSSVEGDIDSRDRSRAGSGNKVGIGTSVGGGIGNRAIKNRPRPSSNYNENGDVVVSVCANADGSIDANSIKVQNKGTTTTSIVLRNIATSNARQYRFEEGEDKQCGTITYRFRANDDNETNRRISENSIANYAATRTFYAPIYNSREKVVVRNDFRSTIFWQPTVTTDDKGEATVEFYNSDALSTFRATLEGIGATGRAGRAEYRYATNMALNLSAKMPDKVLTGDVVKIPLSLKNNSKNAKKVSINVTKPSHFEAVGDIPSNVTLAANEAKTLYLPYKVATQTANVFGESQTFVIETTSDDWSDKFEAKVKTLPRGFPVTQVSSADKLENSFNLNLRQPVEKTATLTLTAYPNALDDILQGMERMLRQPSGCFEQVSSSNYPNLLVLDLLQNTQNIRPDVAARAKEYLQDGYKRLTAYECKSGGFDWWGRDPAHEGLTAYGILEFTDMARVFEVDKKMIDRSVKWLLNRKNGKGGWTLNPNNSHGWQNDVVLDAYIVYALANSGYGNEISAEIETISNSEAAKKDTYIQALLANTYLNTGAKDKAKILIDRLLKTQAQDGSLVGNSHSVFHAYGNAFKVETTALAALALMQAGDYDSFLAKAMSFIVQSKSEYGYGNTQSTVMALKALCNYARGQKNENSDGTIAVLVNDKKVAAKAYSKSQFGKVVIADLEQFMTSEKDNIKVIFEQTNKAIPYDLTLKYASKMPQNAAESPLQFNTTLATSQAKIGDVVRQTASMKNISKNIVASPIMIVGIPAGLTAQPWQLKQIVERKECAFYEIFNNYIVFYFDEIKANELITIHLDLRADIGGSYEAPASAAYPYYTNEWRVWSKPEAILVN